MAEIKKSVQKVAYFYIGKADPDDDRDLSEMSMGQSPEELERKQKKFLEDLKNVVKEVENVEEFIEQVKEAVKKNNKEFEKNFIEPYVDDFLNTLLLDLYKKKVVDKKKFEELKKKYKEKGIDVFV